MSKRAFETVGVVLTVITDNDGVRFSSVIATVTYSAVSAFVAFLAATALVIPNIHGIVISQYWHTITFCFPIALERIVFFVTDNPKTSIRLIANIYVFS